MPARRFLLHVGYPKTGTTSLQKSLFPNSPGIRFLGKFDDGPEKFPAELPELETFRTLVNYGSDTHVEAATADFAQAILTHFEKSSAQTALVSLEGFTNPFVDTHFVHVKDLKAKMRHVAAFSAPLRDAGIEVELLFTLRRQTDLLPSLFSQIYSHAFATGLFEPSYDAFLDFLFTNDVLGSGPDFMFDDVLDRAVEIFGAEAITALDMSGLFGKAPGRDLFALAAFLRLDAATCADRMGTERLNVRDGSEGRRMKTGSPGIVRFQAATGMSATSRAFGLADRIRIRRGRSVYWSLPDRSGRIAEYYAASNTRLADRYDIVFAESSD